MWLIYGSSLPRRGSRARYPFGHPLQTNEGSSDEMAYPGHETDIEYGRE